MSERKGWGQTVVGWFIVQDETHPVESDREPVEYHPTEESPVDVDTSALFKSEPPPAPGGQVDFVAVFEAAGVDQEERDRVDKALALVRNLPSDTPFPVKKQIVEASLKAFNVQIDKIIEAGVEEIQALEGYIRTRAADTSKLMEESDLRIRQFEDEVRNIRMVMQQTVEEQQSVIKSCNSKKLEVQQILEFFGQEAVARVVRDSPKLIDPAGPSQ